MILTASLLSAELEQYTDDFDTAIREPRHRARFTFEADDFCDGTTLPGMLALAARTTASFPGAFEASYIPIGEAGRDGSDPARPDMDGVASFRRSHWAVDGGVLMNKPVGPALEAIQRHTSNREVRRVIAYVNPDPGSPRQQIDVRANPPTLGEVVLKSIVTLPRAESIADHLDELRSINQQASDTRDLRDSLLRGVRVMPSDPGGGPGPGGPQPPSPIPLREVARDIYPFWIKQRAVHAIDDRLEAHYVRARIDPRSTIGRGGTDRAATFRDLRIALQQERGRRAWLASEMPIASPAQLADRPNAIDLSDPQALWRWGFSPLEYIADLALDLIRRTYEVLPVGDGEPAAAAVATPSIRQSLGSNRQAVHDLRLQVRLLREMEDDFWADHLANAATDAPKLVDCPPDLARFIYDQWPSPPASVMRLEKTAVTDGEAALSGAERQRLVLWRSFAELLLDAAQPEHRPVEEPEARQSVLGWLQGIEAEELAMLTRRAEMRIARALADGVTRIAEPLAQALNAAARRNSARSEAAVDPCAVLVTDPAVTLGDVARGLGIMVEDPTGEAMPDTARFERIPQLLLELLSLYVVQSTTDDPSETTYRLDLIQVSAFADNRITPERRLPEQKVAGLQVGHFGGFLKRSWRANDWMWGAMDGADRLISVLVEPARLRQRFVSADEAMAELDQIFTGDSRLLRQLEPAERAFLQTHWAERRPAIVDELAFLSSPAGVSLPKRLPRLCEAAAYAAQLVIGREQLPVVARAVAASVREGSGEPPEAIEFVEAVRHRLGPDTAAAANPATAPRRRLAINDVRFLLGKCKVGIEAAGSELSSDLGAATAAKAAAVAGAAMSGARSGLGALSVPAKSLRAAVMGVYFTTAAALRKTKIGVAITFLLLAIGGGAVAARLLGADVPGPVLAAAVLLLAVWWVYTGLSAKAWLLSFIGALVLVIVALSFIEPDKACTVFADVGCSGAQPGWKDAVRWIVLGVLAFTAVMCVLTAIRFWFAKEIEQEQQALGAVPGEEPGVTPPGHNPAWMLIYGLLAAGFAVAYALFVHDFLFTGDADDDARRWVIERVQNLGNNRAMITLVGIPAVFLGLEYARLQYTSLRSKWAHRRALKRLSATSP